jgi:hypothetical protein
MYRLLGAPISDKIPWLRVFGITARSVMKALRS